MKVPCESPKYFHQNTFETQNKIIYKNPPFETAYFG